VTAWTGFVEKIIHAETDTRSGAEFGVTSRWLTIMGGALVILYSLALVFLGIHLIRGSKTTTKQREELL
jgi:hypothetical protein